MAQAFRDSVAPHLFPHVAPYPVYDETSYTWMTEDEPRLKRYRVAVAEQTPKGGVVLDLGTGRDLNWARAALDAGARKVYAIELDDVAVKHARKTIDTLRLGDRLVLIHGNSFTAELPERVDLMICETTGDIGGNEGQWAMVQDAHRRFLKSDGLTIPRRAVTRIAAASLPSAIHDEPLFGPEAQRYVKKIFDHVGWPFDLRVGLPNFDAADIVSSDGLFEDLDFSLTAPQSLSYVHDSVLRAKRSGCVDGFVLWLELYPGRDNDALDSLKESSIWYPTFFPAFYPGIDVTTGDEFRIRCATALSDDGLHPDYTVSGEIIRHGERQPFSFVSTHHGKTFRGNAFYRALFAESQS